MTTAGGRPSLGCMTSLTVPADLFDLDIQPHPKQRRAVELASTHRVVIVTGGPGCIDADTELLIETHARRGRGGRRYRVEDAYHKFHQIPRRRRGGRRFWCDAVYTLSHLPDGGVNYNEIRDIVYNGDKEVFEVTSAAGRVLRVTQDHPFRVPEGGDEEGYVRLADLDVGHLVVCRRESARPQSTRGRNKTHRRDIHVPFHPSSRAKTVTVRSDLSQLRSYDYALVREARLVVEADLNNMSLTAFVAQLQESAEGLSFLPGRVDVHHINGDVTDNRRENLVALDTAAHAREHGWNNRKHFGNQTTEVDRIISIKSCGVRPVYDLVMSDIARNYVAGGYVVHNCGKTFTVKAILRMLEANGLDVKCCAPTGKAAQRMREQTGRDAATIHRLLGWTPEGWTFDAGEPAKFDAEGRQTSGALPCDAVVVDEVSMVDVVLFAGLMKALTPTQRLVIVGDVDQLPSIGPGRVLHDLIESGVIPVVRLTHIFRQASESRIPYLAREINQGEMPDTSTLNANQGSDVAWLSMDEPEMIQAAIVQAVADLIPQRQGIPSEQIQVLCPQHGTPVGDEALNCLLQERLNPNYDANEHRGVRVGRGYRLFKGDRVLHANRNNYDIEVMNGEVGTVVAADWRGLDLTGQPVQTSKGKTIVLVDFGDRQVGYNRTEAEDLELAYAITIHKCVAPDTLIPTASGLQQIRQLPHNGEVLTPHGTRNYTSKYEADTETHMLQLTTKNGYQITVTPNHGMDVWRSGSYVREEAANLKLGDYLRLKLKWEGPQQAPMLPPTPEVVDTRAYPISTPAYLDAQTAEFFGLMVADGTVYDRGFRLAKRHPEVVARFTEIVEHVFGRRPRGTTVLGTPAAELNSVLAVAWLRAVGGMTPNDKQIPACILSAPSDLKAAFLRGLFEDGSAKSKNGKFDYIELAQANPVILATVQIMLLELGIIARHNHKIGRLYIYGVNGRRFADQVGFITPMKQATSLLPTGRESRYGIPVTPEQATALGMSTYDRQNARTAGRVSRAKAEEYDVLSHERRWHHEQIHSIEWTQAIPMCLTVPDGHQFLQNGFSGWNSQGSQFPCVVMPVHSVNRFMLTRPLVYTAVTRAESLLVLIGEEASLEEAVKNTRGVVRRTTLQDCLQRRAKHESTDSKN